MLVKSSLFAHKHQQPPVRNSVVAYQGAAKYDHVKKAAELLLRQQHTDKTELEIAVSKVNALEQDKRDLLETSTKLLETNVKQETSLKAEKSMYSTLRFDVVASQTLSASVKDYVANLEKKISARADEMSSYTHKLEHLKKGLDIANRETEREKAINNELNSTVPKIKLERERLQAQVEEERKYSKEIKEKTDVLAADVEVLNSKLLECTSKMDELTKLKDSLSKELEVSQTQLIGANQLNQETEHALNDLKAEKESMRTQLESEVAKLSDTNKSLQSLVEESNRALGESQKELELKNNALVETQSEVERKQVSITALEEASAQQKMELEKNKQQIEEYLSEINSAAVSSAELVQVNAQLKSQLEERTIEVQSLRDQATDITGARDRLHQECASHVNAISELRGQLQAEAETTKSLSTNMETGERRAESLQKELEELRKAHEIAVKNQEDLRSETSKLGEQHAAASAEWKAKEMELAKELESIKGSVETKLTKQQEGFDNLKAGLLAEVRRVDEAYSKERKDHTDKIASLAKDADKYKGLYTEAQKAMDAAKAQLQIQPTPAPTSKRDEKKNDKKKGSDESTKEREEDDEKIKDRKDKADAKGKDRKDRGDEKTKDRKERAEEKSKDRTAEKRKDDDEEKDKDKDKEKEKRSQSKHHDFFVNTNEVPTELEPDDASTQQDEIKKKRKLFSKPASSELSSPSKKVRFTDPKKTTTYAKPRKIPTRSRKEVNLEDDVYAFKG